MVHHGRCVASEKTELFETVGARAHIGVAGGHSARDRDHCRRFLRPRVGAFFSTMNHEWHCTWAARPLREAQSLPTTNTRASTRTGISTSTLALVLEYQSSSVVAATFISASTSTGTTTVVLVLVLLLWY